MVFRGGERMNEKKLIRRSMVLRIEGKPLLEKFERIFADYVADPIGIMKKLSPRFASRLFRISGRVKKDFEAMTMVMMQPVIYYKTRKDGDIYYVTIFFEKTEEIKFTGATILKFIQISMNVLQTWLVHELQPDEQDKVGVHIVKKIETIKQ